MFIQKKNVPQIDLDFNFFCLQLVCFLMRIIYREKKQKNEFVFAWMQSPLWLWWKDKVLQLFDAWMVAWQMWYFFSLYFQLFCSCVLFCACRCVHVTNKKNELHWLKRTGSEKKIATPTPILPLCKYSAGCPGSNMCLRSPRKKKITVIHFFRWQKCFFLYCL